jgi:hypothetical protein
VTGTAQADGLEDLVPAGVAAPAGTSQRQRTKYVTTNETSAITLTAVIEIARPP